MDGKPEVFINYFSLLIFCNNFRRLKSHVFEGLLYWYCGVFEPIFLHSWGGECEKSNWGCSRGDPYLHTQVGHFCHLQWNSQPEYLFPLCKFQVISKLLSLFISLETIVFAVNEHENICIKGDQIIKLATLLAI